MPTAPVISPSDETVADLCLAADGLLSDHVAGGVVESSSAGRRARVTVSPETAQAALAAGELLVADAETVPVVRLRELTLDGQTLTGTAERAGAPTGIGHQLRTIAGSEPITGRSVLVLNRPLLVDDLDVLAAGPSKHIVLVTSIASPSPDGVPVATMLHTAQHAATQLSARGLQTSVLTATLHWRDPESDRNLAAAVAAALGTRESEHTLSNSSPQWAETLTVLREGGDLDAVTGDPVLNAELTRWRRPRDRRGLALFFTGLSGAGKSTIARLVRDELVEAGERTVTTLDGDEVRRLLSAGLGFGAQGRDQNVRRIGYVAAEVTRHGGVAICAPIAPYEASRAAARAMVEHAGGDFVLVYVATSLEDAEARDVKGLYARARAGEIAEFTGISDPYEAPADPELLLQTAGRTPEECAAEVLEYLRAGGWLLTPADQNFESGD